MKTHIDKLRNPNYLGGWDLIDENGKTVNRIVTIKDIKTEAVFNQTKQENQDVITVFFNECKPMILNATNRKTLKKVTDTEYIEDMVGKKIELTTKKVKAFGEIHDAIRIAPTKPQQQVKQIDAPAIIAKIKGCNTLVELSTFWTSILPNEKVVPEILAAKDLRKSELTPKE